MRRYEVQKLKSKEALSEVYKTIEENRIYYNFPVPNNQIHKRFEIAFAELSKMLSGESPMEITKAVYLVEGAYDSRVRYSDLKQQVQNMAHLSKYVMEEKVLQKEDNLGSVVTSYPNKQAPDMNSCQK